MHKLSAIALLSIVAGAAHAQLPPAPTPVPGSPLDRPPVQASPSPNEANGGSAALFIEPPPQPANAAAGGERARFLFGTAFRVDPAGHLVTNRHIVEACEAVGVIGQTGIVAELRTIAIDTQHDLALLAGYPGQQTAPLRASDEPLQGEDLLSYGFPLPGMLSSAGQLGSGMVTALSGIRNDPGQFQTNVPMSPGSSGAPLIDRRGQVVGVMFAKLNALRVAQITGDLPMNVNFAVRLAPLKSLLDAHGVRYAKGASDAPQLNSQEIAAQARDWTVPIACKRKAG